MGWDMRLMKSLLLCAVTALVLAGGMLAIPTPASALPSSVAFRPDYWVNVSSNGTRTVNDNSLEATVGLTRKAGRDIVSRAYYHFDVSSLVGKNILEASVIHQQTHSPNLECNLDAFGPGVQLGRTDPVDLATSWPGPAWRTTLDVNTRAHGNRTTCPGYLTVEWEAEAGVEQAVTSTGGDLTLGFRSADESDLDGLRMFGNEASYPVLIVKYNTTPNKPSRVGLYDPPAPCATSAGSPALISSATPQLSAYLTDADGSAADLRAQFELYEGGALVWSLRSSTDMVSGTMERVRVPADLLAHDHSYWFRVRAEEETEEGMLVSGWSPSCHFKVDTQYPRSPTVTSDDYPECRGDSCPLAGGVGVPGDFTFSSDSDVVEYRYFVNGDYRTARPSAPGEPVTVSITPDSPGLNIMEASAVDASGHLSASTRYSFNVRP